jgi:hypothetical protein
LNNWIPYKEKNEEGNLIFNWIYTQDKSFNDPFFEDTVLKLKSHPYNSSRFQCLSDAGFLVEASQQECPVSPAAFIFHSSRCGSTLLTQLLACSKKNIVLSEVPLIDKLLNLIHNSSELWRNQYIQSLRACIDLLSIPRQGEEQHVFIKLDSWHVFFYPLIKELYPKVPLIIMYRNPEEIIVSQSKQRGMQFVPGTINTGQPGTDKMESISLDSDSYMRLVLQKILEGLQAIAEAEDDILLLNYIEHTHFIDQIEDYLKISYSKEERYLMKQRAGFHSKYPKSAFEKENIGPATQISPLTEVYQKLQNTKKHKSS